MPRPEENGDRIGSPRADRCGHDADRGAGILFSCYPYVLEATAAVLSIMGIVELLRAAGHCTWRNVLLLSLMAVAICMRRLPYYGEILLITWILAIVAFALFMRHKKEAHSIGFWRILPCTLMLPIFFTARWRFGNGPGGLPF